MYGMGRARYWPAWMLRSGRVIAHVRKRHTSKDFLAFLDSVVKEYPDQRFYIVIPTPMKHALGTWREGF